MARSEDGNRAEGLPEDGRNATRSAPMPDLAATPEPAVPLHPRGEILTVLGGPERIWGIILAGRLEPWEVARAIIGAIDLDDDVQPEDIEHLWAVHDANGWWPDETGYRPEVHDERVAATLWRP
jgi:hypothetical protein